MTLRCRKTLNSQNVFTPAPAFAPFARGPGRAYGGAAGADPVKAIENSRGVGVARAESP